MKFKEWLEYRDHPSVPPRVVDDEYRSMVKSAYPPGADSQPPQFTLKDMHAVADGLGLKLKVKTEPNPAGQYNLMDPELGYVIMGSNSAKEVMDFLNQLKKKNIRAGTDLRGRDLRHIPDANESFDPKKRLKDGQKKLDVAPPFGKIDADDFKKLRGQKK